jgi:hypothetical protein
MRRCAPPHRFPIARISSSHDFARSHDRLRRSTARMTKKRQKMTPIISISPKPQHATPHKFVIVMARRVVSAKLHREKYRRFIVSHQYDY